eukprot:838905-Pelagomonas_calceolata.AAC.3
MRARAESKVRHTTADRRTQHLPQANSSGKAHTVSAAGKQQLADTHSVCRKQTTAGRHAQRRLRG